MRTRLALVVASTIAMAASASRVQAPARMQGTVVLTIGANESAPDEYQFDRITAKAIAPDGRLVIADAGFMAVRVYDTRGRFIYDLFREGEGPGEIKSPAGLGFSQDGLLWVRDDANARWSAFRLGEKSASFVKSIPRSVRSSGDSDPVVFDRAGLPIDIVTPFTTDDVPPVIRVRMDAGWKVVASDTIRPARKDSLDDAVRVTTDRDGNVTRTTITPVFGSKFLLAHAPIGEYARAIGRKYDVEWRGEDGRPIRHIRRNVAPVPFNAHELDAFKGALAGARVTRRAPSAKAAIETILFDQESRLWVVRNVPAGSLREADVFDRTGRHVSTMVLPRYTEIGASTPIRNNSALVRLFDTTGIARVGLIRFK